MAQVLEHDLRRVIDGERRVEGLADEDLVDLYRQLVLLRTYDERSLVYHRQGRIGTYAIFWNHEAMQVGSAYALGDDDWIFPSYRESAIGLLRGMPAATILQWWRGHPSGWWNPADYNVASICVPIATQVPHAVGLAWGKKLRGEDAVSIVYFGDGATSEGSFHEGANFAGVMREMSTRSSAAAIAGSATRGQAGAAARTGVRTVWVGVVAAVMRAGITAAEAEPPADPELVFAHAYVDPPENMRNG